MEQAMFKSDAWELVNPYVYIGKESPGEITEEVKSAAIFLIDHELRGFSSEQFCIAVCCNLSFQIQRKTAWLLVSDMLSGEFSWITPLSSFSVEKALAHANLIPENYFGSEKIRTRAFQVGRFYFDSSELMKKIVEKFGLPTCRLHPNKTLNEKEKTERGSFNASYRGSCFRNSVL